LIEQLVSEIFARIGHTWKTARGHSVPTENEVEKVLDLAAGKLYDRDIGTRLEIGGLIIDKQASGHDVFVYVGNYK
jgi:hypothetical protein